MHYYQHHIGDFIKATARLTDAQSMAYLRLLWMYYDSERPIPDNQETIAFQLGTDETTVRLILTSYFKLHDGQWHHTRCDKEIAEFQHLINKRSNAGKASAEQRSNKRSTSVQQVSGKPETSVQLTNNHKPITNNQQPKTSSRARGTRLQQESLPEEWFEFCKQERSELNPDSVFDQFRDYWIAQPGDKGVKTDWFATWRNWVRNQRQQAAKPTGMNKDEAWNFLMGRGDSQTIDLEVEDVFAPKQLR